MYAYQLRRWFDWCDTNGLDPLGGIQRAHVELYIRHLGDRSYAVFHQHDHARRPWVLPVRAHRRPDPADPAVYARLPRVHHDESRTQGLDRLELIRFLQVAQAITVHHGALDAQETVASLLADASSLPPAPEP